ncbi:hypothetical protein ACO0K2_19720, partial [Undibacterium sp. MH2W]|uniref:hypothetical protein n=1 Tax=Undibacterium sp. MH2W TaxID=3413044 RepID=UPI003BF26227
LTAGGLYNAGFSATYCVVIDSVGAVDTFKWGTDNCSTFPSTGVPVSGGVIGLSYGVAVQFANNTGHAIGDKWVIQANALTQANQLFGVNYNGDVVLANQQYYAIRDTAG